MYMTGTRITRITRIVFVVWLIVTAIIFWQTVHRHARPMAGTRADEIAALVTSVQFKTRVNANY